jgi:hypothetical protein
MVTMNFATVLAACAGSICLLAACGGGGTTIGTQRNCPLSFIVDSLVYPAPASTGVPDAAHVVIVSGVVNQVTLRPAVGVPIVTTSPTTVPSPLPSPNASKPFGQETAFALPTLGASTTFTVVAELTTSDPPCPFNSPQQIGSFTTQ